MVWGLGSAEGEREPRGLTPRIFLKMSRLFTRSSSSSSRLFMKNGFSWR
jgi:hypothetical protein